MLECDREFGGKGKGAGEASDVSQAVSSGDGGESDAEERQPAVYMGVLWKCGKSGAWGFLEIIGSILCSLC